MKRIHPNVSCAATCAAIALALGCGGCRSSSSGIAGNPFLSPDRVPPPSTRALLPGQAQPYYQGDPLPVMQSATTPPANNLVASDSLTRSASGATLAWNSPGGAAPAPLSAPEPRQLVTANEAGIAVPTDADPLRFALPAPVEPEPITPIATAPMPTSPQPLQQAAAPSQGVQLASYTAPAMSIPSAAVSLPTIGPPQQAASPWRSPQVAPTTPLPMYGMQSSTMQPVAMQPITIPAPPFNLTAQPQVAYGPNSMPVQLRAVPSPPPQPGDPMPRIRVPGYLSPQTATNADGFRPRSSMR